MTRARSTLVSVSNTPYYHCIGRCVRRAFLCGMDAVSGKSYEHRKPRILKRLTLLTEVFAIDLCAYALMSNHYHLVVRLAPERAAGWSDREVVEHWQRIYTGPPCGARYLDGAPLDPSESVLLASCIKRWRQRLVDLSWFMRCLNEFIARTSNIEDECTGRFWEGRFKSQALLDEEALLTVMAYVDLNPVRAGLADCVAASDFTSGQQRLGDIIEAETRSTEAKKPALLPFVEARGTEDDRALPFNLQDYLDLLDSTGRVVHPKKRGTILDPAPSLLATLNLEPGEWLKCVGNLHVFFRLFIGAPHRLSSLAERRGWRWIRGQSSASRLYQRANE